MTQGELDDATRRALNLLDNWLEVTGCIVKGCTWYYELQSVIEDAVHCGAQAATKDYKLLDSEKEEKDG
jgi:uncharacterized heparinase superfamily protein